jgi:gliding motility-associated lipoprotein GldH
MCSNLRTLHCLQTMFCAAGNTVTEKTLFCNARSSIFAKINSLKHTILFLLFSLVLIACGSIDVFEKNAAFKNHSWKGAEPATVSFTITDTASLYNLYLVVRHQDAYNFNNIWVKITRNGPDTTYAQQLDVRLATNEKGWLGTGMDDIWEHRVLLTARPVPFRKSGVYTFSIEHIMRQEPLEHVMNIGMRIEKVKP